MRKQNKPTQCDRILDYLKKFGTIKSQVVKYSLAEGSIINVPSEL